ncbi:TKL family protein kinase [Trichomonas vaginalis G3]|uniref:TKL family protein kinase n=1 Tax=Trichomonas vaginalis (strain ATCC PRA-98 / G3) TaxID=412133 RepID=A2DSV6_TRIV3|nr:cysteine S-palmitoyltransferase protein [Trichomonas vaginalis G3]EAY16505.1 TKL family protein kinase [Trichomonas vaginalis G3]KAI5488030.1 cysteine S-palmitoyltransferase protein [Trichomonas vaginalis G3]|eukprot:XP_001328728.1 TKL family protein kinase [Trichomonas vaginalis G3]
MTETESEFQFRSDDFEKKSNVRDGKFIRVDRVIHKVTKKKYTLTTIKIPNPKFKNEENWLPRIKYLASLHHPAIKTIVGYIDNGNLPILVDDDEENMPAFLELTKFKINSTNKICLLFSAAVGLKYLHDNNIVHGDFKTKSIYVSHDMYIKVADYAPFQIIVRNARKDASLKSSVYIAPELYQGSPPTKESDIYAFGTLLFSFYTLKFSMGRKILNGPFSELAVSGERVNIPDIIPIKIQSLIERCWKQNPQERPTMEEIVFQLYTLWDLCFFNPDSRIFKDVVQTLGGPPPEGTFDFKSDKLIPFNYTLSPFPSKKQIYYSNADCELLCENSRFYAAQIIHLQKLLTCMKVTSAELVASYISDSIFVKSPEYWDILVENIMYISRVHYRNINDYATLIFDLIKQSPQIKDFLLESFFAVNDDENCYPAKVPVVTTLYFLKKLGAYSDENIVSRIRNLFMSNQTVKRFISILFCYFAPEIEKSDPEFYQNIKNMVKNETQNCFFPKAFSNWFKNLKKYRENNWKFMRESIEEHKSVYKVRQIIINDDYKQLSELMLNPDDTLTTRIEPEIYDPCIIMHNRPNIAHACPIHSATRCFQILQLGKFDLSARDLKYMFLPSFIIASNCEDFYDLLTRKVVEVETSLQISTSYFRYELFYNLVKLDKADITKPDKLGYLLINAAVISGNVDILLYCLSNGVDVMQRENFGWTPLHWAAFKSKVSILSILNGAEGVDPNIADDWGITPLHLAAEYGSDKGLQELMRYKNLNVNICDKRGQSPLHKAVESGEITNVKIILSDKRVDTQICDKKKRTPYDLAIKRGRNDIAEFIKNSRPVV